MKQSSTQRISDEYRVRRMQQERSEWTKGYRFSKGWRAQRRRNPFWLITKRRHAGVDVLTMGLDDGRTVLPVFSFEEEAALYLRRGLRGSWQLRRTEAGELVSLLCSLCREVELVALDPVSDVEADVMNGFVSLERERFVDVLLRR